MEIVIDIPEELYNYMQTEEYNEQLDKRFDYKIRFAVKEGTPLDLEGLKSDMKALNCGFPYGLDYLLDCLDKRLGITIIEAER